MKTPAIAFMTRISVCLILAAVATRTFAQDPAPLSIAHREGHLRRIVTVCFIENVATRDELMAMSARFIQALSATSAVPLKELEAEVARGNAELASQGGLMDRCARIREEGERTIRDRDAKLITR